MRDTCVSCLILLAESDAFVQMGRRFRPGGSVWHWGHLVALLVFLTLLVVGLYFLARYLRHSEEPYHSPRALFHELCRAHGLDRASRRLLVEIARQHRASPASAFVQPGWFAIPAQPNQSFTAQQIRELRDRLFETELFQDEDLSQLAATSGSAD